MFIECNFVFLQKRDNKKILQDVTICKMTFRMFIEFQQRTRECNTSRTNFGKDQII